jgi:O-antigen/teichoic acid export membrane protein
VAQRLIERERALADGSLPASVLKQEARFERRRRRRRALKAFFFGLIVGIAALVAAAMIFGAER